jgi:hypothetical protein
VASNCAPTRGSTCGVWSRGQGDCGQRQRTIGRE